MTSRKDRIQQILLREFRPSALFIDDESHSHSGHRIESHFKVLVVSDHFKTLKRVDRQRLVNEKLQNEFNEGLHALSLRCLSSSEYEVQGASGFVSPNCAGSKTKT